MQPELCLVMSAIPMSVWVNMAQWSIPPRQYTSIVHFSNHTLTQSKEKLRYIESLEEQKFFLNILRNHMSFHEGIYVHLILFSKHPALASLNSIHYITDFRKGYDKFISSRTNKAGIWPPVIHFPYYGHFYFNEDRPFSQSSKSQFGEIKASAIGWVRYISGQS